MVTRCIQYEKAATLYNVAAIYSQMGTKERLGTADGKKKASAYFQKAAGVLVYIRDFLTQRFKIQLKSTADLHEVTLSGLATLMLAQAAECFYQQATHGTSSLKSLSSLLDSSTSSLTAVIAIYVSDLYDVSIRHSRNPELLTSRIPKSVSNHIKAKFNLYSAIAQFHTGPSTSADRAVAERLARLGMGKKLVAASIGYAQEVGGYLLDHVVVFIFI